MADEGKAGKHRHKAEQNGDWASNPAAMLVESNQRALAQWVQGAFSISQEMMRFAQQQWQENMAVWSALAACHSINEALEYQGRFASSACQQYIEEFTKLSQMATSLAPNDLSGAGKQPGERG